MNQKNEKVETIQIRKKSPYQTQTSFVKEVNKEEVIQLEVFTPR